MFFYRKAFALNRLLDKEVGKEWGFDGGDREWRDYIARFVYWEMASERSMQILNEVAIGPFKNTMHMFDGLAQFFQDCQKNHIAWAFKELENKLTPGIQKSKIPFLDTTARRLIYR